MAKVCKNKIRKGANIFLYSTIIHLFPAIWCQTARGCVSWYISKTAPCATTHVLHRAYWNGATDVCGNYTTLTILLYIKRQETEINYDFLGFLYQSADEVEIDAKVQTDTKLYFCAPKKYHNLGYMVIFRIQVQQHEANRANV